MASRSMAWSISRTAATVKEGSRLTRRSSWTAVIDSRCSTSSMLGSPLRNLSSLPPAMQYYGFGSVIGTMWDFGDGGAEDLSLGFYNQMVSGGAGDTTSLAERSAEALRYPVQTFREKAAMLQRWVT